MPLPPAPPASGFVPPTLEEDAARLAVTVADRLTTHGPIELPLVADTVGVTPEAVAVAIGLPDADEATWRSEVSQARLGFLVRALVMTEVFCHGSAEGLAPDDLDYARAWEWFTTADVAGWNHQTPASIVAEGHGHGVLDHLIRVAMGGYA